jgi:hypothetical protein
MGFAVRLTIDGTSFSCWNEKAQDLVRARAWSGSTIRMIYMGIRHRFGMEPLGNYFFRVLAQSVGKTPSLGLLGAGVGAGFGVALALSIFVIVENS